MPEIPTHVTIPFRGKLAMTAKLVNVILAQQPASIHLIDNGTKPDDPEWSKLVPHLDSRRIHLHRRPTDSLTQMWNFAWRQVAKGQPANLAILNNDITVGKDFLARLAEALRSHDDWWIVCPDHPRTQRIPDRTTGEIREVHDVGSPRSMVPLGGMCGWAFMVRCETPAPMPLDEQFRWFCGDDEAVASVNSWGYKVGLVQGLDCEHVISATLGARVQELQSQIDEDVRRYAIKRG